jgi:UDP-glucuronate 4-epimerase
LDRIFITGGAGFIGSHLAENLLYQGKEILILDNFDDYYSPETKRKNMQGFKHNGSIHFVEGDILDYDSLRSTIRDFSPDVVIHLAAKVGVRHSLKDPIAYQIVNVMGTAILLEIIRVLNITNLIFASSSSVYGDCSIVPFMENDTQVNPISPYGMTKKAGEVLCYNYHMLYNLKTICLRFFSVYGPRQRPDMAIRKFIELIDHGIPIEVYGGEDSFRDYTYIDDIVRGITGAITYVTHSETPLFEIINLGGGQTIDLMNLIRLIEGGLKKNASMVLMSHQPGDVKKTHASIEKAKALLKFSPSVPIEVGIMKTIEAFKRHKQ